MRVLAIAFALVLSACSTVDATIDGTGGIIKGVGSDVFGVTTGLLDVTSNLIKDVATKTGTDATAPTEEEQEYAGQGWHYYLYKQNYTTQRSTWH